MTCKIEGCQNPVYGHGLCAKHYFRQRRHGDATVTHRPGPKPSKPKPEPRVVIVEGIEVEALRKQLDQANAEISELKRRLAGAQEQARPRSAENEQLREEKRRALAVADERSIENVELRRQLAEATKPRSESKEVAELQRQLAEVQRQLKATRTRNHNLTVEKNAAWRARDEARKANPAFVTQAKYRTMLKAFHPDSESRVSQERKAQLTAAAQVFNDLVEGKLEEAIKKTKAEEKKAEQGKGSRE